MKINVLQPSVFNKISAGEVVERPASIVKELVENSIDAGATEIRIEIESGGVNNIVVSDNGCGIEKDDLVTAFLPHATSKIKSELDLENIMSLGFRGEALASISAVSRVRLSSKTADSLAGYSIRVDGGEFGPITETARSNGTTISCSNLFFNTPARAKFLRKNKTEENDITSYVEKLMLSNSDISFKYIVDDKIEYKMFDYKNYGMSSLSTVEHPIQCFAFIKTISEKLNREDFEFFLNDEDKYSAYICNSDYDTFIDVYLSKTFENCTIQTKPQIYCSYQLPTFDTLSFRKKGLNQTKNW